MRIDIQLLKLRIKITIFVALLNFCLSGNSLGASQIAIGAGSAAYHGDLSSDSVAPAYLLSYRIKDEDTAPAGSRTAAWYTGFEIFRSEATHDGRRFPYADQATLSLLGFFFTPGICQGFEVIEICASIGIGTLNVNSQGNRQDYGTWNYQVESKYRIGELFFAQIDAKKIGDIEQTVEGRAAHFWLTSILFSLGYRH